MRRILKITISIIIAMSLSGCKPGNLPLLSKDTQSEIKDEEISYSIDQVILSKGYQSIEPNVEIVKKNKKVKLLASLGLLESSGVYVEKITKKGNIISIYVHNETDEKTIQLAVPQIIINMKNLKTKKLDELKFNIVNENYKPLSIKLGLNEVINKINSNFKVASNTSPDINLLSVDDKIIWDVTYNSIFDRDNPETPLVNLSVNVDANTGEILQSSKSFISSFIDEGHILDYAANKFILYKKTDVDKQTTVVTESIWYFDIEKDEKTMIYTSKSKVLSALFSPDLNYISLLEGNDSNADLYIIPRDDIKAIKVFFQEPIIPKLIRWKDKNNLYIVENNGEASNIYSYNLKENKISLINNLDANILNMRIRKDLLIITEGHDNQVNKRISYTDDLKELRFADFGFSPRFIDDNLIGYLKKDEKEDKNQLYIYDTKNKKEYDKIDLNISNYFVLPDSNLFIVEKNHSNNDFTIYEYKLNDKELTTITKVNSDNIYYNKEKNLIYVDLAIPFETEKSEIIYSIDLSKLINIRP